MENIVGDNEIDVPDGWGFIPEYYHLVVENLKKLFLTDPFGNEKKQQDVKNEIKDCDSCFNGVGPVVPSSVFLNPSADFLKSENLEKWFPLLKNKEKFHDLCPSHLPFDKVTFVLACTKASPIEDLPNVSQESDVQTDNRHEGTADTAGQLKEGTDTSDKKMTIWK